MYIMLSGFVPWCHSLWSPMCSNNVACPVYSSFCSPPLRKVSECGGRTTNLSFPTIIYHFPFRGLQVIKNTREGEPQLADLFVVHSLFFFISDSDSLLPFTVLLSLFACPLLFSLRLFVSTLPASSSLCVFFSLTCLLTTFPSSGFKTEFSTVLLTAGASSKFNETMTARLCPSH